MSAKLPHGAIADLTEAERAEMERCLTAVWNSLQPYPEARAAVAAGLDTLDLSFVEDGTVTNKKTAKRTQQVIDNTAEASSDTVGEPRVARRAAYGM